MNETAYPMVSSLAPNSRHTGSPKASIAAVSTTESTTSSQVQLPMTRSAVSVSPLPMKIEAFGAPPMLTSAAKVAMAKMMGAVTPTPASACGPASVMRPMNILSMRL